MSQEDLQRARQIRTRARKLYLRAHRYGLRRLEASYQGITEQLETDPQGALSVVKKEDIPALYWTAAALGLAISVSKNDAEMLARLPEVEAFLEHSLALDESWDAGALHEFQITLAGAKPGALDVQQIKKHFDRALQLSGGGHAGLYVAYAEVVSVKEQNRGEFRSLLERALAIDPCPIRGSPAAESGGPAAGAVVAGAHRRTVPGGRNFLFERGKGMSRNLLRLIVGLILMSVVFPLNAQNVLIKMGTLAPEGTAWHDILLQMREDWSKISAGRVTLRIYPSGVLGDGANHDPKDAHQAVGTEWPSQGTASHGSNLPFHP